MRSWHVSAGLLAILAAGALVPGCTADTCGADDLECFFDHLALFADQNEGPRLDLTILPTSSLPKRVLRSGSGGTGGSGGSSSSGGLGGFYATPTGGAPSFTSVPSSLVFDSPGTTYQLEIPWTDLDGCTPTFCVQVCNPRFQCSTRMACTHGKRDGSRSGVWRSSLGFLASPPDTPAHLATDMTPMSSTDCSDPVALLQAGKPADVRYGPDIAFAVQIDPPSYGGTGSSTSGGSSGGTCSSDGDCGGGICSSGRECLYGSISGSCDCTSAGQQCVSGSGLSHCATAGESVSVVACCPGLVWVNGTCKSSCP